MTRRTRRIWFAALAVAALAMAPVVLSFARVDAPALRDKAARTRSADNLQSLALLALAHPRTLGATGKRFVLSLASAVGPDPRNHDVFFSPGDATRSRERAGGAAAFGALTPQRLADPAADLDRFTSYVGSAGPSTPAVSPHGRALFADLSFDDVAIVAFADGRVETLTRKDLGLSDSDPLRVGPTSKSPLLRTLAE